MHFHSLSVTHHPHHTAAADLAAVDLFSRSVKAKFHTKIPSTFYTAHKKCLTLPKCLQLHLHQSRDNPSGTAFTQLVWLCCLIDIRLDAFMTDYFITVQVQQQAQGGRS